MQLFEYAVWHESMPKKPFVETKYLEQGWPNFLTGGPENILICDRVVDQEQVDGVFGGPTLGRKKLIWNMQKTGLNVICK